MRYALPFIVLLAPTLAFAAPQNFRELVGIIVLIVNVATPMLVALALVYFLFRGVLAMTSKGQGKESFAAKFRQVALWSLLILFVMVSIWGILAILEDTFINNNPGGDSTNLPDFDFTAGCDQLDAVGC